MDNVRMTRQMKARLGSARVFGCTFIKRDGSERTGSFRLGVAKGLTGKGPSYDTESYGNMIVWDMNKGGYRTIPLNRVKHFMIDGEKVTL